MFQTERIKKGLCVHILCLQQSRKKISRASSLLQRYSTRTPITLLSKSYISHTYALAEKTMIWKMFYLAQPVPFPLGVTYLHVQENAMSLFLFCSTTKDELLHLWIQKCKLDLLFYPFGWSFLRIWSPEIFQDEHFINVHMHTVSFC